MKILLLIFVIVLFLGSPLWTSAIILLLPRRRLAFSLVLLGIQVVLAYAVWWFFWGSGIGAEMHLSESWQGVFLFTLAPFAVTAFRMFRRQPKEI